MADCFFCRKTTLALTLVSVLGLGCSGGEKEVPMFAVKGFLKVDGKPVPDIDVRLIPTDSNPKSLISYGKTNAEGKFSVAASNGRQGATKGKYKVLLGVGEATETSSKPGAGGTTESVAKIREQYDKKFRGVKSKAEFDKRNAGDKPPFPKEFLKPETTPRTLEVVDKPVQLELDL